MSRLLDIREQIADSAARSIIRSACLSNTVMGHTFYDINVAENAPDARTLYRAVEYLELSNMLVRNTHDRMWVRLVEVE